MTRQILPSVVTVAIIGLTLPVAAYANTDSVQLGVAASESAHNVSASATTSGTGALNQRARWLGEGGSIAFDIAVDGTTQNYITTRFWGGAPGSSGNQGSILLADINGNAVTWGQLDEPSTSQIAPDRWYYATVPIPRSLTDGQSTVRLNLLADGISGGGNSRAAYSLFSHTETRFTVTDNVPQNPFVTPYDYGDYQKLSASQIDAWKTQLTSRANNIANQVANMQVLDTTGLPSALLGAFDIRTGADDQATLDATHSHHISTDNLGPLRGAEVLAYAYNTPGTDFHQDAAILNRVALGIDYTRRAQGASGGYVDVWQPVQWVGGPNRSTGTGALEGITHDDIAVAFLQTHQAMQSAGLLDQLIDDDNSSATPMVTRRQAYTDLFKGFIEFHTGYFSGRDTPQEPGHAPNQEVYQVRGLAYAYQALKVLDSTAMSEADFQAILKPRLEGALGLTRNGFNNSYWFSPEGLPLEAGGLKGGGYSSEYGQRVAEEAWPVVQMLGDNAAAAQRAADAAKIWQYFWYPVYRADSSYDMRLEGAINWRNLKSNGLQQIFPAHFAALDLGDPALTRTLQLSIMNNQFEIDAPRGGHFWQDGVWMMEQITQATRLLNELSEDDLRLPHEAGQPDFAFVDIVGSAVSIKVGDRHIFMALNWHHGSVGSEPISNDIARIHEITPFDDRIATVAMSNPFGFGQLSYLTYGELLIATNGHATQSYLLDVLTDAHFVFDLVSGQYLQITDGQLSLSPMQAVVLNLSMTHVPEPAAMGTMLGMCGLLLRRSRRS